MTFSSSLQPLAAQVRVLAATGEGMWLHAAIEWAHPKERADRPFTGAGWSEHESSCHYRDYRELPSPTAGSCPKVHPESGSEFVLFHPRLWIVHVWAWYPNPGGLYAEENPYLSPYGGNVAGGHDFVRGRTAYEIAYSEF